MVDDPRPGPETSGWLLRRAPRFTRLWAAKAVSHLGDGAALVALVVYVQQTQGRGPGAVSALLLATTLPTLVGPPAGALVDRVEQRRLMLGAQAGQALLYGAMATVLPPFPVLLVLVAAASLLATVFAPAGRSVVPSLVSPGELVRANSWMGMALTFQGTIGPAVGGVLVAGAGVRGALWGNALSFGSRPRWWLACPSLPQEADGQRVGLLKGNVGRARLRTRPPGRPGAGDWAGVRRPVRRRRRRCGCASTGLTSRPLGWQAAHRDHGETQVAHLVEGPVQGRLILQRAGQDGLVALVADVQAAEPLRPAAIQDALHPDLVSGRPPSGAHASSPPCSSRCVMAQRYGADRGATSREGGTPGGISGSRLQLGGPIDPDALRR
jgi:Major Facilitator Superfamily